ncbi:MULTISPECIES: aminodeoxychorismate synthase component I [Thermoactinomyces]|jgi:para-aminobenzoate synthetase component I|uniref:aminodeoxychorismate synthase n=1 Tax=Thermoactinomyces daqus TaxID=1329516 RepID=A0A7W1XB10_9BACL|nr:MULTISPECIES: aminodeoxychorismate synthase component I [Thermoactinomyces]MBA4543370.1 aminodeoxychorismate synthase component I [Thermoactinomyces daqus]MBH8599476.1 aminodeoxychorismate synthase component I [Thermoactinomyces sp. CICC 10523]MBH8605264.1 aminodeoxychorismate synthase component I [Thermoactinomyces sp. CICC 10522]MBH8608153.1 aminodeoxychorismate synthase component I [Thermoactinomyces sp. CICC 10521]
MKWIIREIPFKVRPEHVFAHLYRDEPYAFWLDGNRLAPGLSRYSFMGANPSFLVRVQSGKIEWIHQNTVQADTGDPFQAIQKLLDEHQTPAGTGKPFPFIGGLVGYFGYEMNRFIEKLPDLPEDPTQAPVSWWMFADQVLIYDQLEGKSYLSKRVNDSDGEKDLEQWLSAVKRASDTPLPEPDISPAEGSTPFAQVESYDSYCRKIRRILGEIAAGNIYQACFTHQLSADFSGHPFDLYRILRRINPAPFSAYLRFGDLFVLSTSPERFLKLEGRRLESRPIKGTRPRGRSAEEDDALVLDLKSNEKDRAENVMIVDLVRNDLGKVCETGSVRVSELLKVESYATVHQLVTVVEGRLKPDVPALEAIRAAFPGGSMTGAPKIRAMEILHDLEPVARGIYSGGLGYLDVRGGFDLSMVIRTIIVREGKAFFHVGGGIVADSDEQLEYQESMDKALALKKAILLAGDRCPSPIV